MQQNIRESADFERAVKALFLVEGGFSNDPKDAGGKTRCGITEAVALANGFGGRMEELSREEAARIAKSQYWDVLRLDVISSFSYPVAYELLDTGYHCGVGTAGRFLQRALNALNRLGQDYEDLTADGVVGPMTVRAVKRYLQLHPTNGEKVLLRALNALQGAYYIDISVTRPASERFEFGWFLNRVEVGSGQGFADRAEGVAGVEAVQGGSDGGRRGSGDIPGGPCRTRGQAGDPGVGLDRDLPFR